MVTYILQLSKEKHTDTVEILGRYSCQFGKSIEERERKQHSVNVSANTICVVSTIAAAANPSSIAQWIISASSLFVPLLYTTFFQACRIQMTGYL